MSEDSHPTKQPPRKPLSARLAASNPRVGPSGGPEGLSGPQAGACDVQPLPNPKEPRMTTRPDVPCIWCPDTPRIPASEFEDHVDREHPSISDPRNSTSCWSRAEVGTPDAVIHEIACGRGRHRWGKHRNRHVRWACPPRCGCIRHARKPA